MTALREPAVRADGRCARPGCSKPLPRKKEAQRYAGVELLKDPFCSTECCKAFHGVKAASGNDDTAQAQFARSEWEHDVEFAVA